MIRFPRQPEPAFWGPFEHRWLYGGRPEARPLHKWHHDKKTLATCFHAEVRAPGDPRSCAYCDGPLAVESAETIDHFVPQSKCRQLALAWDNLYPACSRCNTVEKRAKASCWLLRPDVDPVEAWIDYDEQTGRLGLAPEVTDRATRLRVRRTLRVFGLNTTERNESRRRLYRTLENAWRRGDNDYVAQAVTDGPYRFVARRFLASKKPVGVLV
jgi:uncharacterized protein (TIGR02646 family)